MPGPTGSTLLYDGKVELLYDDPTHVYKVEGLPVDSITGVLRVISKPALLPWAVKLTCEHLLREWEAGKAYDEFQIDSIIKTAKAAHRVKAEDAATIGTMVHNWIERYLQGENPPMPVNEQMRNGVAAFLKFEKEHDLKVTQSERKVYSKEHHVAGTCDIYGTYEGAPVIADIKTSSGIYPEAFLQTGGYDICLSEETGIRFEKHLVINCKKTGGLDFAVTDKVAENRAGFIAALHLNRALKVSTEELKKKK